MGEEPHGIMDVLGSAAGKMITDVLRSSLRSFLDRPPAEPAQPGPPRKPSNRFISRAAPVPLPPPPAAVPPPAPAESQPPASAESKPASPATMDFVGHIDDRPKAEGSTKFPTFNDYMEDRADRLDLNKAEGPPRMKSLRGPVIGQRQ